MSDGQVIATGLRDIVAKTVSDQWPEFAQRHPNLERIHPGSSATAGHRV